MKTILVYGLKNVIGGIENYLMMMHKHLHKELRFVFLIEETDHFLYQNEVASFHGIVEFLPERHRIIDYIRILETILKKYNKETDTVYVNIGHISFDILPIRMALKENYKVIVHSHNAMQEPIRRMDYRIRQSILRLIGMRRLKNLDVKRLAVSFEAGDYLFCGKPYEIVTPGIEIEKFCFNSDVSKKCKERLSIDGCIVLGYVGRLVSIKNPLFLIDILKEMNNRGHCSKLLVLGDGDLKDEMIAKASEAGMLDSMLLLGEVSNVCDYLQTMDILLAPSLSEGLGLFVVEAQAAGLPCICAKGNIPTTIDVTGQIVFEDLQTGSSRWCDDIERVLYANRDKTKMNILVGQSEFNIENASRRLLEVILSVSNHS